MPDAPDYPLSFEPILKSLLWGGRRLGTVLSKAIGEGDRYAESWEIADHRKDVSRVRNGPLAGASLRDLVREHPREILGDSLSRHSSTEQFPLLVKFLDAHAVLSVQVHPDDERGKRLAEDNGKTEAWVILHAEPHSKIYAGLRPGVSRNDLAQGMRTGRVEPLLHAFEASAGDCVFIPAGTVHAIGAGIVLAEIQQSSDATFRVYDWGRVGPDGKSRELHPDESLESTDFHAGPVDPVRVPREPLPDGSGTREALVSCPYFALDRLRLTGPASVGRTDRFTIVLGLGGESVVLHPGRLDGMTRLGFGETLLLPAALGACEIVPAGEGSIVLTCVVP
jgi:mannose-6-phosphate isomerase